jgi:hypothetical protein
VSKTLISPVELVLLLHYSYMQNDHPEIVKNSKSATSSVSRLKDRGLLMDAEQPRNAVPVVGHPAQYQVTDKGTAYLNMVLCTPMPVQSWTDPREIKNV